VLLPPPATLLSSYGRYPVIRKVPRPPQPIPPNQSESGPTQILVPNSDTSLSYSQSQPLSQSQSHSLDEVPESSQPVVLSQLSPFSKPRKDLDPVVENSIDVNADNDRDAVAEQGPLFSVSFDEDVPYEGDLSSLDPANEEYQSSPLYSMSDLVDASMIAQPADSQHQTEEIHADSIDDDAPVEFQIRRDAVPLSANHETTMDVTQELDEDDAQIHHELFGSSYISQSQGSLQREYVPGPQADPDHSRLPKSPIAVITDNTQPTPEGDAGTGVGVVQHDAKAWSAPSFLRPSSSVNTKTSRTPPSSTDVPLGKSNAANTNSTDRRLKASLSREASLSRNRPDQNQDPAEPCMPRQPKIPTQAPKKTPLAPGLTLLQSRPNKRRKDVASDTELSRPHAKKRRVELIASTTDTSAGKIAHIKPPVLINGENGKLKGFTAKLDGIMLDEQSQPLISWWKLKDILLKTGRDRDEL
jgi:hypothetical protein